jgi:conjugal transfer/entry exclusion protein
MQLSVAASEPMASGGGSSANEDGTEYLSVDKLKKQYYDYLGAKTSEIEEAREARHYYHGDQWTEEEIRVLKRRKQPVVTSNRIERKINAVVGIVEKLRQDPKAYARTPQHEQGADVATAVMRYALDTNDWKSKSTRNARLGAIDGIAGVEFDLETGDQGDRDLGIHIVYADTFFYDPRSFDEGFTDARYMGIAKWIDVDQAKELIPSKASEIDDLMEAGSDITSSADQDRERVWVNTSLKRLRLVDHWYICKGKWCWTLYIGNTVMMQGESPFHDEKGRTFPRFLMFSANVDHDGDRYGFVRTLKSAQDEINMRRSKALHLLNTRRVISEKGAVDDIEIARREWAKPDGWVETNPGLKMAPDESANQDFSGQLEMLQESKNEIENFGPNPALVGEGLQDSSGRAIALLQQAGMAELGPYLSSFKNWKIRVYRCIWNIITEHWKAERWIRVTDDQNVAQFFKINKLEVDQYGRPAIVNAIGSMDVDFIIDEGQDAINMQADAFGVLQSLGPQFAQQFPEIAIELSPIEQVVKTKMLKKIQAAQQAPPKPDPKVLALQAQQQLDQQAAAQEAQHKQAEFVASQQMEAQKAQFARQQAQEQMAFDWHLKEQQFSQEADLERRKAVNQMHIESMKAAAGIEAARAKGEVDAEIARSKATAI